MIRNILVLVVAFFAVGFVGTASAQQSEDGFQVVQNSAEILASQQSKRQTSKVAQTLTTIVEKGQVNKPVPPNAPCPRGKVNRKIGKKCYCVAVDTVARADNKRQDEELGALRDQVSGPNGLVKIVGDVDKNSKDRDTELQKQIDTKASKEDVAAVGNHDNLWWWIRVIGVIATLGLIAGIIGWFLPRGHTHANGDAPVNNLPANPPAPATATAAANTTAQTPLGLAGNNPPANPPAAPIIAVAPLVGQNRLASDLTAPGPRIDSISNMIRPDMISTDGGYKMTINGSGFQPGCKVFFGDTEALNVIFVNIQRLIAEAPPSDRVGKVAVRVVNSDGQSVTKDDFAEYF